MAVRAKMSSNTAASAKNRRLALQMANRPSVKAALGQGQQNQRAKQRLGVQARLGVPGRGRGARIRGGGASALAGRLGSPRGLMTMNRGRGGQRGRGLMRGSLGRGRGGRGSFGRGGQSVSRGGGGGRGRGLGQQQQFQRGQGGRGRGQRGGRGGRGGQRGGGQGGARGAGRQFPSREDLDLQLDAYMAGSDNNNDDWS